jgi:type I site-specific restriction endonuclease
MKAKIYLSKLTDLENMSHSTAKHSHAGIQNTIFKVNNTSTMNMRRDLFRRDSPALENINVRSFNFRSHESERISSSSTPRMREKETNSNSEIKNQLDVIFQELKELKKTNQKKEETSNIEQNDILERLVKQVEKVAETTAILSKGIAI